jgi:hypothetical protein
LKLTFVESFLKTLILDSSNFTNGVELFN